MAEELAYDLTLRDDGDEAQGPALTPRQCRPDRENARHADATLETATGRMGPYGQTGRTADSGSHRSCRPCGQTLRTVALWSLPAWSIRVHVRTTCTRERDTPQKERQRM